MQIRVCLKTGKTAFFDLEPHHTVFDLKKQIANKTKCPIEQFKLTSGGSHLNECDTLLFYFNSIKAKRGFQTIHMISKLRAGAAMGVYLLNTKAVEIIPKPSIPVGNLGVHSEVGHLFDPLIVPRLVGLHEPVSIQLNPEAIVKCGPYTMGQFNTPENPLPTTDENLLTFAVYPIEDVYHRQRDSICNMKPVILQHCGWLCMKSGPFSVGCAKPVVRKFLPPGGQWKPGQVYECQMFRPGPMPSTQHGLAWRFQTVPEKHCGPVDPLSIVESLVQNFKETGKDVSSRLTTAIKHMSPLQLPYVGVRASLMFAYPNSTALLNAHREWEKRLNDLDTLYKSIACCPKSEKMQRVLNMLKQLLRNYRSIKPY